MIWKGRKKKQPLLDHHHGTVHVFGFWCVTKKFVLEYFAASAAAYLIPIVTNAIASFVRRTHDTQQKRTYTPIATERKESKESRHEPPCAMVYCCAAMFTSPL